VFAHAHTCLNKQVLAHFFFFTFRVFVRVVYFVIVFFGVRDINPNGILVQATIANVAV